MSSDDAVNILHIISGLHSAYSRYFDLVVFTFFYSAWKVLTVLRFMVQEVSSLNLILSILVWIQISFRFLTVFSLLPNVFRFSCAFFLLLFCVKVAHCASIYDAGGFKPGFDSFDLNMISVMIKFHSDFLLYSANSSVMSVRVSPAKTWQVDKVTISASFAPSMNIK